MSLSGYRLSWDESAPMLRYLVNFIFPPRCAGCAIRLPIDAANRVCARCIAEIERLKEPLCEVCGIPMVAGGAWCERCAAAPPHFSRARAITIYGDGGDDAGGVVGSIIRRHKYGLDQSLSRALAECLGARLPLDDRDYDVVIPVPLHRGRLRWRGFNQAAMLGAVVARRIARPLDAATLTRVRATPPQTARNRRERRENMRGAFTVRRPARIANHSVLLVDDVMTTGATADECARMLIRAGARRVDVLTLARVL